VIVWDVPFELVHGQPEAQFEFDVQRMINRPSRLRLPAQSRQRLPIAGDSWAFSRRITAYSRDCPRVYELFQRLRHVPDPCRDGWGGRWARSDGPNRRHHAFFRTREADGVEIGEQEHPRVGHCSRSHRREADRQLRRKRISSACAGMPADSDRPFIAGARIGTKVSNLDI
jgi:hypothetical protein